MNMKLGFLGFGEAAYNLAEGLKQEGYGDICAYDIMAKDPVYGTTVNKRAQDAKVVLKDTVEEVVYSADIIIASVSAAYTLDVCESAVPYLNANKIYVDVSASTPQSMETVGIRVAAAGAKFVDVAMMGSLPKKKHKVEILACGNGAAKFYELMTPYHMNITVIDGKDGTASGIKLIRSIYMKGIAALLTETAQAARKIGIEEQVFDSISQTMDGFNFRKMIDFFIPATAIHAKRRSVEMTGAIEVLESYGLPADMSRATKETQLRIAAFHLNEKYAGQVPKDWREVVDIYNEVL